MSDTELNERIRIDGAEESVRRLNMVAGAADRIAKGFGEVLAIGKTAAGIAGLWEIGEAIHETDQLYQSIVRVKAMLGVTADNAHTMFDMFELSGIGMEQAERIMTSMARLSGKLGDGVTGTAEQAAKLAAQMKKLGVDVTGHPEEMLYSMADAAELGKLKINDLIKAFAIPRSEAAQMMEMLQGGAQRLRDIRKDTLGGADLITEDALQAHKQMIQVKREFADAWGGFVGTMYKNMIPVISKILEEMKAGFDDIQPVAEAIGKVLRAHMEVVVALAKTYLALLVAAKALNLVAPGEGMGVYGRAKQIFGGANRMMTGRVARAGAMDYFEARAASPGISMFANAGGPLIRILSSVAGRFGVIGIVIGVLAGAFMLLKNNTMGIRDAFVRVFSSIWDSLKNSVMLLMAAFSKLFDAIKPVLLILGGALLGALWIVTKAVEFLAWLIEITAMVLAGIVNAVIWAINQIPGANIDYINMDNLTKATKSADAGSRGSGSGPSATVNQDFRGSKFEIQNNFPEGIDGGRVAVAIGDELAALGERRLDSGLRPVFSYR